jgi:hypothetical protein
VESDKEVTSKGSTLLLGVCSKTKKQVENSVYNFFLSDVTIFFAWNSLVMVCNG